MAIDIKRSVSAVLAGSEDCIERGADGVLRRGLDGCWDVRFRGDERPLWQLGARVGLPRGVPV